MELNRVIGNALTQQPRDPRFLEKFQEEPSKPQTQKS